ncbi:hypothetical protein BASA81_012265 [Batrachochytrium salamandrivorans]|nr:hypothetical protein BASA81_012265 [Batrachochytrium salamandrivorans]
MEPGCNQIGASVRRKTSTRQDMSLFASSVSGTTNTPVADRQMLCSPLSLGSNCYYSNSCCSRNNVAGDTETTIRTNRMESQSHASVPTTIPTVPTTITTSIPTTTTTNTTTTTPTPTVSAGLKRRNDRILSCSNHDSIPAPTCMSATASPYNVSGMSSVLESAAAMSGCATVVAADPKKRRLVSDSLSSHTSLPVFATPRTPASRLHLLTTTATTGTTTTTATTSSTTTPYLLRPCSVPVLTNITNSTDPHPISPSAQAKLRWPIITTEHPPTPTPNPTITALSAPSIAISPSSTTIPAFRNQATRIPSRSVPPSDHKIAAWRARFKTFSFYLDGFEPRMASRVSKQIKALGANLVSFLSTSVTHLVTVNEASITESLTNVPLKDSTKTIRGQSFLAKKAASQDPVQRARRLGTKVWPFSKLNAIIKFLLPECSANGEGGLADVLNKEKMYGVSTRGNAEKPKVTFKPFKGTFILIEDIFDQYRPVISHEFPEKCDSDTPPWPIIHFCHPSTKSVFLPRHLSSVQNSKTGGSEENNQVEGNDVGAASMGGAGVGVGVGNDLGPIARRDHSAAPAALDRVEISFASGLISGSMTNIASMRDPRNNPQIARLGLRAFNYVHTPADTALQPQSQHRTTHQVKLPEQGWADRHRTINKRYATAAKHRPAGMLFYTRPGYCENCNIKYDQFQAHVKSKIHLSYAANEQNFRVIDGMIAKLQREELSYPLDPYESFEISRHEDIGCYDEEQPGCLQVMSVTDSVDQTDNAQYNEALKPTCLDFRNLANNSVSTDGATFRYNRSTLNIEEIPPHHSIPSLCETSLVHLFRGVLESSQQQPDDLSRPNIPTTMTVQQPPLSYDDSVVVSNLHFPPTEEQNVEMGLECDSGQLNASKDMQGPVVLCHGNAETMPTVLPCVASVETVDQSPLDRTLTPSDSWCDRHTDVDHSVVEDYSAAITPMRINSMDAMIKQRIYTDHCYTFAAQRSILSQPAIPAIAEGLPQLALDDMALNLPDSVAQHLADPGPLVSSIMRPSVPLHSDGATSQAAVDVHSDDTVTPHTPRQPVRLVYELSGTSVMSTSRPTPTELAVSASMAASTSQVLAMTLTMPDSETSEPRSTSQSLSFAPITSHDMTSTLAMAQPEHSEIHSGPCSPIGDSESSRCTPTTSRHAVLGIASGRSVSRMLLFEDDDRNKPGDMGMSCTQTSAQPLSEISSGYSTLPATPTAQACLRHSMWAQERANATSAGDAISSQSQSEIRYHDSLHKGHFEPHMSERMNKALYPIQTRMSSSQQGQEAEMFKSLLLLDTTPSGEETHSLPFEEVSSAHPWTHAVRTISGDLPDPFSQRPLSDTGNWVPLKTTGKLAGAVAAAHAATRLVCPPMVRSAREISEHARPRSPVAFSNRWLAPSRMVVYQRSTGAYRVTEERESPGRSSRCDRVSDAADDMSAAAIGSPTRFE